MTIILGQTCGCVTQQISRTPAVVSQGLTQLDTQVFDFEFVNPDYEFTPVRTLNITSIAASLGHSTLGFALNEFTKSELKEIEDAWSDAARNSFQRKSNSSALTLGDSVEGLCLDLALNDITYDALSSQLNAGTVTGAGSGTQFSRTGSGYRPKHGLNAEVDFVVMEATVRDCQTNLPVFYVLDKRSPRYALTVKKVVRGYGGDNEAMLDKWTEAFLTELGEFTEREK